MVVWSCGRAVMQSCSHVVVQSCGCADWLKIVKKIFVNNFCRCTPVPLPVQAIAPLYHCAFAPLRQCAACAIVYFNSKLSTNRVTQFFFSLLLLISQRPKRKTVKQNYIN